MNTVRPFAFLICTAYTADLMLITPFLTFSSHNTPPPALTTETVCEKPKTPLGLPDISPWTLRDLMHAPLGTVRPRTIRRATTRLIHPQNNWTNKMLLLMGGHDHVSDLTNSITRGGRALYHGYTTVWLRTILKYVSFGLGLLSKSNAS